MHDRGTALDGMPIVLVMLVPVHVLRRIVVAVGVRVGQVRMTVVVPLAQFTPSRIPDPCTERDQRKRRDDAHEMTVANRERGTDGPQHEAENERRGDVAETGDRGGTG